MKIKRVASYETTDGQVFTDKKAAQAHQKNVDRRTALFDLINADADLMANTVTRVAERDDWWMSIDIGVLADFILNHADELRAILPQRAKPDADAFVADLKDTLDGTMPGSPIANNGSFVATATPAVQ